MVFGITQIVLEQFLDSQVGAERNPASIDHGRVVANSEVILPKNDDLRAARRLTDIK